MVCQHSIISQTELSIAHNQPAILVIYDLLLCELSGVSKEFYWLIGHSKIVPYLVFNYGVSEGLCQSTNSTYVSFIPLVASSVGVV